jgi:hypothetical protein
VRFRARPASAADCLCSPSSCPSHRLYQQARRRSLTQKENEELKKKQQREQARPTINKRSKELARKMQNDPANCKHTRQPLYPGGSQAASPGASSLNGRHGGEIHPPGRIQPPVPGGPAAVRKAQSVHSKKTPPEKHRKPLPPRIEVAPAFTRLHAISRLSTRCYSHLTLSDASSEFPGEKRPFPPTG